MTASNSTGTDSDTTYDPGTRVRRSTRSNIFFGRNDLNSHHGQQSPRCSTAEILHFPLHSQRRTLRERSTVDECSKQVNPVYEGWKDPNNKEEWDIMRVLQTDSCLAEDNLLQLPNPYHSYLKPRKLEPEERIRHHPKLAALMMNGTATWQHRVYYAGGPDAVIPPISGKLRDKPDPRDIHDHWATEARGRRGSTLGQSPSSTDFDTDSNIMGDTDSTLNTTVIPHVNDSEVRARKRTKRPARISDFSKDDMKEIGTELTRGAGRKLSRKALNQARDTRPYQGNAR